MKRKPIFLSILLFTYFFSVEHSFMLWFYSQKNENAPKKIKIKISVISIHQYIFTCYHDGFSDGSKTDVNDRKESNASMSNGFRGELIKTTVELVSRRLPCLLSKDFSSIRFYRDVQSSSFLWVSSTNGVQELAKKPSGCPSVIPATVHVGTPCVEKRNTAWKQSGPTETISQSYRMDRHGGVNIRLKNTPVPVCI